MRTTFNSSYRNAAAGIQESSERLARYQRQVSSGKRIDSPRDDPSGTSTSIAERAQIASYDQYTRATDSVSSRLTIVDTVLSDIVDKLTAAQTATQSARGSEVGTARRESAAQELSGLRDALFDDFNMSFNGVRVFSGGASNTAPYGRNIDGSVTAYQGTAAEMQVDIDRGRSVRVTFNGDAVAKGGESEDLFQTLGRLITAVRSGDNAAMGAGLDMLTRAFSRVSTAQSRVGQDLKVLDDEKTRLGAMKRASTARLSSVEDANLADAISGMTQADTAYRAALGAAGTILRVSLLDYLK